MRAGIALRTAPYIPMGSGSASDPLRKSIRSQKREAADHGPWSSRLRNGGWGKNDQICASSSCLSSKEQLPAICACLAAERCPPLPLSRFSATEARQAHVARSNAERVCASSGCPPPRGTCRRRLLLSARGRLAAGRHVQAAAVPGWLGEAVASRTQAPTVEAHTSTDPRPGVISCQTQSPRSCPRSAV